MEGKTNVHLYRRDTLSSDTLNTLSSLNMKLNSAVKTTKCGRLVIPFKIRKELKIEIGDLLDITLNNNTIIMKKLTQKE